jgi:hypothetical protein
MKHELYYIIDWLISIFNNSDRPKLARPTPKATFFLNLIWWQSPRCSRSHRGVTIVIIHTPVCPRWPFLSRPSLLIRFFRFQWLECEQSRLLYFFRPPLVRYCFSTTRNKNDGITGVLVPSAPLSRRSCPHLIHEFEQRTSTTIGAFIQSTVCLIPRYPTVSPF